MKWGCSASRDSSTNPFRGPTTEADAAAGLSALDLPRVFSPAEAAWVLRSLGLTEMTECALRTRAYRKRVPFHLNGRRITFTLSDLREIAEGEARRPQPAAGTHTPGLATRPVARRCSPRQGNPATRDRVASAQAP